MTIPNFLAEDATELLCGPEGFCFVSHWTRHG